MSEPQTQDAEPMQVQPQEPGCEMVNHAGHPGADEWWCPVHRCLWRHNGYSWECPAQEAEERVRETEEENARLRSALEEIRALPVTIRCHDCLPDAAWEKRREIWKSDNFFERKRLVTEFASILRAQTHEIADAALAQTPGTREEVDRG